MVEVAAALGISPSYLTRVLAGDRAIPLAKFFRLRDFIRVDAKDFKSVTMVTIKKWRPRS